MTSDETRNRRRAEVARATCANKKNYETKFDAERAAKFWRGATVYQCPVCSFFHVTTTPVR